MLDLWIMILPIPPNMKANNCDFPTSNKPESCPPDGNPGNMASVASKPHWVFNES